MRSKFDAELEALRVIIETLAPMKDAARRRVVAAVLCLLVDRSAEDVVLNAYAQSLRAPKRPAGRG